MTDGRRRPFGGGVPVSDFATHASVVGGTFRGELTRADVAQLDIERRRYRRVPLDAPGALLLGGVTYEGPCDISRSGVGLIVAAQPAVGSAAQVWLPPELDEPAGLELAGKIARCQPVVKPYEGAGDGRTFHCFACGWTGYIDAATGNLETVLARSGGSTFGGQTRVGDEPSADAPAACPTCGTPQPSLIDRAYYGVGVDLRALPWREEERFLRYLELTVSRRAELGRRRHRRFLLEYVPAQVRCAIEDPAALAAVFLQDISRGGISFVTTDRYAIGDEVRIALATRDAAGFVLGARIVDVSTQGNGLRYGARFSKFDDDVREDLRLFIELATGGSLGQAERRTEDGAARRRMARQIVLGGAFGLSVGLLAALLAALW